MLHPTGTLHPMMRLLRLASRQLESYRAILTTEVTTLDPLMAFQWRPVPGDGVHSGRPALHQSHALFPVGLF